MKKKRFTIAGIFVAILLCGVAGGAEPTLPNATKVLSPAKEARIAAVAKSSVNACFEELKRPEVSLDEDFLNKAVYQCFNSRKAQALQYIVNRLNQPAFSVDGEMVTPNEDLPAAKAVSRVFAANAERVLLSAYRTSDSDALTKANILYIIGQISGTEGKNLLIEALDDQTFYEETYPEMEGIPLRICDMAYNQLRLRYADELKDLPRTISNVHRIETRDANIDEMASRF